MTNNTPVVKLRDGNICLDIFKNTNSKGTVFYSGKPCRLYTDENGEFKRAYDFSGVELLKLGRLAHVAYDEQMALRGQDRQQHENDDGDQPQPDPADHAAPVAA